RLLPRPHLPDTVFSDSPSGGSADDGAGGGSDRGALPRILLVDQSTGRGAHHRPRAGAHGAALLLLAHRLAADQRLAEQDRPYDVAGETHHQNENRSPRVTA